MSHPTLICPKSVLKRLLQIPSITPDAGGALDLLQDMLETLGFECSRQVFSDEDTADVDNLYALWHPQKTISKQTLLFAGHLDVVPYGDETRWTHSPISGVEENACIYGRGAVDMKGAIAAMVSACARALAKPIKSDQPSIAFLITGDEEGPAINGTVKLLKWAKEQGYHWDFCVVGEPTNPNKMGDMIKIGRRGSLTAHIECMGMQGHVAYPDRANNPLPHVLKVAQSLIEKPLDEGTEHFQPSNLELLSIDVGNEATNIIPQKAILKCNVRFNDGWTPQTLRNELEQRIAKAAKGLQDWHLKIFQTPSQSFITPVNQDIERLQNIIENHTKKRPELSTSGGTSDARFIKDYCPVVEFGLVGQTMHQIDERANIDDLEDLTKIYQNFFFT